MTMRLGLPHTTEAHVYGVLQIQSVGSRVTG